MKKSQKWLGIAALFVGLSVWQFSIEKKVKRESSDNPAETSALINPNQLLPKATPNAGASVQERKPTTSNQTHLQDMTQTLFQFTRPESQLRDLVDYLERNRQEPIIVRNSNPDTGEMVTVRTKSPLPGTRYFHAQYMTDENNKGFVQHMSFEYQPGPTAMNDAIAAVQNAFPNLAAPQSHKEDFIRWNLDEDYIVWIKRMGPKDLENDPFNAYTSEDVGTVRVAIELEIHEPGQHTH